jgi:hypothetical protein
MIKTILPLPGGLGDRGAKPHIAYVSIANHTVGISNKTMLTQNSRL